MDVSLKKCHGFYMYVFITFYPFEGHSQAMRQSLWKKRIGFQRPARLHLRVLVPLIPEIGASSTDLPGPIEMAMGKSWKIIRASSNCDWKNDEVKVPKSGDQEDRHLRSSEILIIIASLTINDMKVTIDSQLISTTAQPFHRCVGRRCHPDREVPDLALDTTKSPGLRHEIMAKTLKTWRPNTIPVQVVYKQISKSYYDDKENEKKNMRRITLEKSHWKSVHPVSVLHHDFTFRTLRFHLSLPSRPPQRKHSGRKWWWYQLAGPGDWYGMIDVELKMKFHGISWNTIGIL